jgi:hypothetical protein
MELLHQLVQLMPKVFPEPNGKSLACPETDHGHQESALLKDKDILSRSGISAKGCHRVPVDNIALRGAKKLGSLDPFCLFVLFKGTVQQDLFN